MSNDENVHDHDIPRLEPWLGVMAGALVPAFGTVYAPPAFLTPLIAIAALLVAAGLLMLRRQTLRRARERDQAHLSSISSAAGSRVGEVLVSDAITGATTRVERED